MTKDQNTLQNHRPGSRLEHFWLDGVEGELHPAEQRLLDCVALGDVCEIGTKRPVAATGENSIRASFLRFLILGGDENAPVHERGVRLCGAYITCICSLGRFDLDGADIDSDIILKNCTINGPVNLQGSSVKTFSLQGSNISGLFGDGMKCAGGLLLRNGFHSSGMVRLVGADIEVDLNCEDGRFTTSDTALVCDGIKVGRNVFLRDGFQAEGTVRLPGATISGDLDCSNSFFSAEKFALIAQNTSTGGHVYLCDDFQAAGEVDFRSARVGGNVHCNNAIFSDKDQSLTFNRATIGGMVLLGPNLLSAGQIAFSGTQIGRDLSVQGVSLEGRPSLQLRNAEITGTLTWRGIKYARGMLDLTGTSCRDFSFDEHSWQKPKEIKLTNFAYQSFTEVPKSVDGEYWNAWLARQPQTHLKMKFRPKPYEFLADVLFDMGYEEEARAVRVEKQRRQTDFMQFHQPWPRQPVARMLRVLNIFWRRAILGPLIDYGYRPGKAGLHLITVCLIGTMIYGWAAHQGIMTPTNPLIYQEAHTENGFIAEDCTANWVHMSASCQKAMPSEHSEFHPLWYSADVLLPLVDLRQEVDWAPRVVKADGSSWLAGRMVRWWEWIEIMAGWLLSLLLVSAIGGFIRR